MDIKNDVKKYLKIINSWNRYTAGINDNHGNLYLLFSKYCKKETKKEIKKQLNNT